MTLNLNVVRLLTKDDPYHYTLDNRPLEDLDSNIQIVASEVEKLMNIFETKTVSGNLAASSLTFSLTEFHGKSIILRIKTFATSNTSSPATQSYALEEKVVFVYTNAQGISTKQNEVSVRLDEYGSTSGFNTSVSVNGDNLVVNFNGYNSSTGSARVTVEKNSV